MYLVIQGCEGDYPSVLLKTESQMSQLLNELAADGVKCQFVSKTATAIHMESFPPDMILVFKGEVVVPQAVQKVTEWRIP